MALEQEGTIERNVDLASVISGVYLHLSSEDRANLRLVSKELRDAVNLNSLGLKLSLDRNYPRMPLNPEFLAHMASMKQSDWPLVKSIKLCERNRPRCIARPASPLQFDTSVFFSLL